MGHDMAYGKELRTKVCLLLSPEKDELATYWAKVDFLIVEASGRLCW
jgi:hypothetical protein